MGLIRKDDPMRPNLRGLTPAGQRASRLMLLLSAGFCFASALQGASTPDPYAQNSSALALGASSSFAWRQDSASVALIRGNQVVWQFNYAKDQSKPFFHPLALPGGPVLTWEAPPDHPWHHALWFSWKFINSVNYWEENKQTGKADGLTRWDRVQVKTHPDFSADFALDLEYGPAPENVVLREKRLLRVHPPAPDGAYSIDWALTFTAVAPDVVLDRTPLPDEPDGKLFGGYAGLSARLAKNWEDVQVVTSSGPVQFRDGRYRGRSPGLDYSGRVDGRMAGLAILAHPDNLNAPSPWYVIYTPEMRYFSPAVLCYGKHAMKAGQSISLRYRVWIHPDRWDSARIERESELFDADCRQNKSLNQN